MSLVRGGLSTIVIAAVPAVVGAAGFSFLDAKFLGPYGVAIRNAAKLAFAAILGTVGRRYLGKTGSSVAVGAVLGSMGAELGIKLAGGMVTTSQKESVGALITQAAYDGNMRHALGALVDAGGGGLGSVQGQVSNFERAMRGGVPNDYMEALAGDDGDGW